ncbi:STAS domain-containing protein [Phytoactinopolyspora halotolerans]|uniref:STAS domain-containing protein n=1 Tax=Phytoactinopolyspora halotolerans TaxID=1981512 RepID=A0A6L9S4B9_9ACTN|nr:STAS domain-containing protein [Phytoactinopolyspora halotolerans]NED98859.1 STAS domain-containing protein [Phytoactinopolyspora halotolerans]
MSAVDVVDRGGREIVVFLSGDIDESISARLHEAVDRVATLERIGGLQHAIVDMHRVTALGDAGVEFLRELTERGREAGFTVSFASMTGPAHRAVEAAGWTFFEPSPPLS